MRSITIDIWDKLRERISVPQREILGRTIRFTITDRAIPVNLTGSTVTIYATKPSGAMVFNALTLITPASGIAEITLTEQMIVEAGTLACQLLIVNSTAAETRTQPFNIEVIASDDFTSSVESSSEYNMFSAALARVSEIEGITGVVVSDGAGNFSAGDATDLPIVDAGNLYTGTTTETALAEIAGAGRTTQTVKSVAAATYEKVDAAGDLLYGSAADTLARMAIGTAGKYLRVNSGATAPEWVTLITESTWTPDLKFGGANVGMSYSERSGVYSRIGDTVFFSGIMILTSKGSSTGGASIAGLPVAVGHYSTASLRLEGMASGATGFMQTLLAPTETSLRIEQYAAGGFTVLSDAHFGATSVIIISGQYQA